MNEQKRPTPVPQAVAPHLVAPYSDAAGRPTLRTVAEVAGVHVSTASRVLNGAAAPGVRTASAQTAARIRRIASDLGYTPNPHATGLRTRRSKLIGVVVPRLVDIVLATIYEGIEAAGAAFGYSAFVANSGDDPRVQRARVDMMLARRVDGIILGDAHLDALVVDELAERGVPFVLVSRHAGRYPSVTCDDRQGGRLVAQHLLEQGHRRVVVLAGEPFASTGVDRTAGFVDAYSAAGHPVPSDNIISTAFDTEGGRRGMLQALQTAREATAVFAVNDFAAIGAIGALRDSGRRVGTDVAVVGYNDVPLAAQLPIALSTVRSPMHDMGIRSVHLLMQRMAGAEVTSERLQPTMMVRESSMLPINATPGLPATAERRRRS